MTIYWERCGICGRYHTVRQCTLYNDVLVCPHCCLACVYRDQCRKPAWIIEVKVPAVRREIKRPITRKREAEKVLLDLLSRLEAGKKGG